MRHLLIWLLRGVWGACVVALPVLGFWLASSLAVFLDGPKWLPWLAGALALLLPMLWEVESSFRFSRKIAARLAKGEKSPVRILTLADRLLLRTTFLNLLFLSLLLVAWPRASFAALSTRGDWMLEGRSEPWTEQARGNLFRLANGLEWLYELSQPNPYAKMAEDGTDTSQEGPEPTAGELQTSAPPSPAATAAPASAAPTPDTAASPAGDVTATPDPFASFEAQHASASPAPAKSSSAPGMQAGKLPAWPMSNQLHPALAKLPPGSEDSIESLASYLKLAVKDPYQRVKAIYDYLALRIEYDTIVLRASFIYPPQDAETVFHDRKGVCAGYANLFKAIADKMEIPARYVVGDVRENDGSIAGVGHAWNAVSIESRWYLIDATWGAGGVDDKLRFVRDYNPSYLLTPPEIFAVNHLPDEPQWQLRSPELTRGDFARQPLLPANFFAQGYQLIEPRRSQISVGEIAVLKLKNPRRHSLMARLDPMGRGEDTKCTVSGSTELTVSCPVPARGRYKVQLYSHPSAEAPHDYVGQVEVVSG